MNYIVLTLSQEWKSVNNAYNSYSIEYQAAVDSTSNDYLTLKNLVWRLSDNKDIGFNPPKVDAFQAIDLMGCKTTFGQYIESHKTDFAKIDSLTNKVVKKYPSAVGDNYDQPLKKRNQNTIDKILSFASSAGIANNIVRRRRKARARMSKDYPCSIAYPRTLITPRLAAG